MNNNYVNAIILWVAIIIAGRFASSQAPGVVSNGSESPLMRDTIAVNGLGRVYATPDILNANVGITETAKTTKEALAKTNEKVKQIIDIAVAEGVDKKDILTTNINMYPHYDYTNGRSVMNQWLAYWINYLLWMDSKFKILLMISKIKKKCMKKEEN